MDVALKILIPLIFLFISRDIFAETQIIQFYASDKPPLVYIQGENIGGIFADSLRSILNLANIKFKLTKVPQVRRRRAFENEEYMIACCSNPAWRSRVKEQKIQFFSDSFLTLEDVYVFRKGFKFNDKNPGIHSYALIKGYTYESEDFIKNASRLKTEKDLLKFIEAQRADVGIVSRFIAQHYIRKLNFNLEIGPTNFTAPIHIRVNKKRPDLLKKINQSIKSLKSNNEFEKIVLNNLNKRD